MNCRNGSYCLALSAEQHFCNHCEKMTSRRTLPSAEKQQRHERKEQRPRRWFSRLAVAALIALLVVVLLPYLLVPLYRFLNPVSTLMVWRWATGARVETRFVPIDRMAPALPMTVIASEDSRFCSHHGVDWQEIQGQLEDIDDIGEARGASTITQQTAKNLFLWPGRNFLRKALELPLALWIDLVLPKWRVLEIYLNIAEWGPNGQFGAEAGSRYAFGKSVRALNRREAALLAAVLPNPHRRSARNPGPAVRRLAGIYESRGVAQAALAQCATAPRSST
jgi:monofunctional biosynthetic peptidoglycan transglycosylase